MISRKPIGADEVRRQLRSLGVEHGGVLLVHSSFGTTGPIDGGPQGLIEVLIDSVGPRGTLVMPSMSDWDDDRVFDAIETPCRSLGIVPDTFRRLPGVLRSDSPHSFAARGEHGARIVAPHPPDVPHGPDSPVGRVRDLDGQVLLLGVDHDANTTVHLAELEAQVPYRAPKFCTVLRDGVPTRIDYSETDHCCMNFRLVGEWLEARGLQRRGPVGHGIARLARSRDIVATVVDELRLNPCRFLCARGSGCGECDIAWQSV